LKYAQQLRVDSTTSTFRNRIESIRNALGHPILKQHQIKCFVASASGLDNCFLSERAKVCAQLWTNDIPSDYVPHSGLMISFLQKSNMYRGMDQTCTLDQLCGMCLVLNIPFVVVVQPHLLNDKASVRLRSLLHMHQNFTEEIIPVATLATTIKERLSNMMPLEVDSDTKRRINVNPENTKELSRLSSLTFSTYNPMDTHRIYVESDRFIVVSPEGKADNIPKPILKTMTTVIQRADSFIANVLNTPKIKNRAHLVAVNVPFIILRDIGTNIMATTCNQNTSIAIITADIIQKHSGPEKTLKTLGKALDYLLKQRREGMKYSIDRDVAISCHVLLHSLCDERFDLIAIGEPLVSAASGSSSNKKEMHRPMKR